MPGFEIKDSGKRYTNKNGGVRDTSEGKINYLLIPHEATKRVAQHYTNGLNKYGKDNWKLLGDTESIERFKISADRHLRAYLNHETPEEDHAAAAIFNIMALIYFEETVKTRKIVNRMTNDLKEIQEKLKQRELANPNDNREFIYVTPKYANYEKNVWIEDSVYSYHRFYPISEIYDQFIYIPIRQRLYCKKHNECLEFVTLGSLEMAKEEVKNILSEKKTTKVNYNYILTNTKEGE